MHLVLREKIAPAQHVSAQHEKDANREVAVEHQVHRRSRGQTFKGKVGDLRFSFEDRRREDLKKWDTTTTQAASPLKPSK